MTSDTWAITNYISLIEVRAKWQSLMLLYRLYHEDVRSDKVVTNLIEIIVNNCQNHIECSQRTVFSSCGLQMPSSKGMSISERFSLITNAFRCIHYVSGITALHPYVNLNSPKLTQCIYQLAFGKDLSQQQLFNVSQLKQTNFYKGFWKLANEDVLCFLFNSSNFFSTMTDEQKFSLAGSHGSMLLLKLLCIQRKFLAQHIVEGDIELQHFSIFDAFRCIHYVSGITELHPYVNPNSPFSPIEQNLREHYRLLCISREQAVRSGQVDIVKKICVLLDVEDQLFSFLERMLSLPEYDFFTLKCILNCADSGGHTLPAKILLRSGVIGVVLEKNNDLAYLDDFNYLINYRDHNGKGAHPNAKDKHNKTLFDYANNSNDVLVKLAVLCANYFDKSFPVRNRVYIDINQSCVDWGMQETNQEANVGILHVCASALDEISSDQLVPFVKNILTFVDDLGNYVDVNRLDTNGAPALFYFIISQCEEIISMYLASNKVDMTIRCTHELIDDEGGDDSTVGFNALMLACYEGNVEIVTQILSYIERHSADSPFDYHARSTNDYTAFNIACVRGFDAVVHALLKHRPMAISTEEIAKGMSLATSRQCTHVVTLLRGLDRKCDDNLSHHGFFAQVDDDTHEFSMSLSKHV